jgi:hypothetical protein
LLTLALLSTLLFGCQSEDNSALLAQKSSPELIDNDKLKVDGKITNISISKTKEDGFVFENDEIIETFRGIISSAIKENGIVNMANPEYYMNVVYENGNKQSFHLWLGKKGQITTLMDTDDTYYLYGFKKKCLKN